MSFATIIGAVLLLLALAGIGYGLLALAAIARFRALSSPPAVPAEPVTILKPLHGPEPRLAANLATFLDQDWSAPVELVTGVKRATDPAIGVATGLRQSAERTVRPVIDPTEHGANAKVGNLTNMMAAASHDLIVLSDSDMNVPRDYLAQVAATLGQPGVGAVTCLYRGRGDAGFWSTLGAAGISYHFLPNVVVGLMLGRGSPCMGSTIALRRSTLDAIGGFPAFADILADDHAIGAAVRARGEEVAVVPLLITHGSAESSLAALLAHELRWAATVRQIVSVPEYLGTIVTYPVPLALLGLAFVPSAGLVALVGAIAVRVALWRRIDGWSGEKSASLWLLPMRDTLSFVTFLGSLLVRSVDWRGQRLRMDVEGRVSAPAESSE